MTDRRITMTVKIEIERVEGGLPMALGFKVYEGMPEDEFHKLGKCLTQSASDIVYGRYPWRGPTEIPTHRPAADYLESLYTDYCGRCEYGDPVEHDDDQGFIHPYAVEDQKPDDRGWSCLAAFLRESVAVLRGQIS